MFLGSWRGVLQSAGRRGVLVLTSLGCAGGALAEDRAAQRAAFTSAWKAAQRGAEWQTAAAGLETYPLWPYLLQADLQRRVHSVPLAEVQGFLDSYAETPLAPRLRGAVLLAWAKSGRWQDFAALWPSVGAEADGTLRCHAWTALHRDAPATLEALRGAAGLWRSTPKVEPACGPAFAALEASGQLPDTERLARIEAAFAAGDLKLVGWLVAKLPATLARDPGRRLALRQALAQTLQQALGWKDEASTRTLLVEALTRMAQRDPRGAEVWRLKLGAKFAFSATEQQSIQEAIALAASIDGLDEAAGWLRRLPAAPYREPRLHEWAARYWLGRGDLAATRTVLAHAPESVLAQPRWRYTLARTLELGGDHATARAHYQAIATDTGFFPFLAADRLGLDYALCERPYAPDATQQQALKAHSGWQRAMEWRALDQRGLAIREIEHLLPGLSHAERVQLAGLLLEQRWYEMTVTVLGPQEFQRYYRLRFPRPWAKHIDRHAQAQGLDPAWTSGLIRAESAFNRHANSSANARGLMQLLPGTARQLVGKRAAAPDLYHAPTNLRLGTRYLRLQLDRFEGDPLATTAAYNAGPNAVARWLPKASRQWPELWVETIPFYETRDYVARVLAFSVVYDWRADGKISRLGARLGLVEDTPVQTTCAPYADAPG